MPLTQIPNYTLPPNRSLLLRTVDKNRQAFGGFQWPNVGETATATVWRPDRECGGGLHGVLHGEGIGSLLSFNEDAIWQIVEVETSKITDLEGKVKAPTALVVADGPRYAVTNLLRTLIGPYAIIGGTATAGDRGTATAGYKGTATAGNRGTATAGNSGTATAGNRGTATAGNRGTATVGYGGTSTVGDRGTATAGAGGTATAGYDGTATAGYGGRIQIEYFKKKRYRLVVGYIGEDGLEPDTAYRVAGGQLVEAEST